MAQIMNRLTEPSLTHHTFEIVNVPHLEKAFANARQKFSRQDFKSATTKAAMHLGPDCEQNLCTAKYTDFQQLKTLFDISESWILNHRSEICGISTIEWHCIFWRRFTMLHNRAIKLSKAKVHVYSDSVLCLGKMHEHPIAMEKWKEQIGWFLGVQTTPHRTHTHALFSRCAPKKRTKRRHKKSKEQSVLPR